jgi:hypothetical protein
MAENVTPFEMFRDWPLVFKATGDPHVVPTRHVYPWIFDAKKAN